MGNEIFYCTECGAQASGSDFAPGTSGFGAERSCCPACLGLPGVSRRESSKRIRRVAVAACPRTIEAPPPRRSVAPLVGAAFLAAAGALAFLGVGPTPPARESIVAPSSAPSRGGATEGKPSFAPSGEGASSSAPTRGATEDRPEGKPRCGYAQELAKSAPVPPELEALADTAYGEIEEAALALADEGRVPDALAQIRKFPAAYRATRAGVLVEKLRIRMEQRAR